METSWQIQSHKQKFLLPSRALMAWDLSDRRDIGREIWPRICTNISSKTVCYECPWCGVRQDRCNHLRKKISREVFFALEILRMNSLHWQIKEFGVFIQDNSSLPSICSRRFYCPHKWRAERTRPSWNQLREMRCTVNDMHNSPRIYAGDRESQVWKHSTTPHLFWMKFFPARRGAGK